jgi:hypothetical protein
MSGPTRFHIGVTDGNGVRAKLRALREVTFQFKKMSTLTESSRSAGSSHFGTSVPIELLIRSIRISLRLIGTLITSIADNDKDAQPFDEAVIYPSYSTNRQET